MEQDKGDLEEGEIEEDIQSKEEFADEDEYVPLKRPENYSQNIPAKRFLENPQYSDSESELKFSDSDSDSDTSFERKKAPKRVKLIPKVSKKEKSSLLKKYDIWSTRAQEDVLAETMNYCDVSIKDRSRESESYDFSLARKYYDDLDKKQGIKRTRGDMKSANYKFQKKSEKDSDEKESNGKPKIIPDLIIEESSSTIEDIAKDIADKLKEERSDLILKVAEIMGKRKCIDIFKETQTVEKEGGMPIMNQTRRRTSGGVFLYLVRNDYHITPDQRREIFNEEKKRSNQLSKEKKKKKHEQLKANINLQRSKILPELLSRAELFAKENLTKTSKKVSEEENCTNPPPSPETDHHESEGDGLNSISSIEASNLSTTTSSSNTTPKIPEERSKLKKYDDDFLDISYDDMDLF